MPGKKDGAVSLSYLTPSEQSALKAVLSGPWMLEQERIPVANAERAIATVFA